MIDTKYLYAAVLLVILVVQLDGQQTGRRKSTDLRHHKHHLSKSPVVGHRSIGGNGIRHAARHSFLNRTVKRGRKRQNSRRSSDLTTYLPIEGDPDSVIENTSGRDVVRVRGGAVGYSRLPIPTWFRPIKFFKEQVDDLEFFGSIIVVTSDTVLLDRDLSLFNNLTLGMEFKLSLMHHRDDPMLEDRFNLDATTGRPIRWMYFRLGAILESGFLVLRLTDPYVRFPDRWLINWRVNYNRHGYRRYGYPEDNFKRPDLGCFGFMYTVYQKRNAERRLVNMVVTTEYPVSIISYSEDERTTVYANNGRIDYKPYSNLDHHFNNGSPVFCGLEGRLRYFARRVNDTTLQLIPLHDIANDLKLVDRYTYDKLAIMTERRDRGDKEPGWMPDEQTPKWFRQMYRQTLNMVDNGRPSWYGGYMIVLTKQYFLVPNYVAKHSLDRSDNNVREWTHFHSRDSPTERQNSFGKPPPLRDLKTLQNWPLPVTEIPGTNFTLFFRQDEDQGWDDYWFKIDVGKDHTESNCNYLEHRLIGTSPEPDTRLDKRTPVFVIPKSCSDNFCYITLGPNDNSTKFVDHNPVMCEGYPAFFLMGNIGNNHRGWLVMKIEYLLKSLKAAYRQVYDEIVNEPEYYQEPPNELHPTKSVLKPRKPPGWFKLILDNSPSGGPLLGYAGAMTVMDGDKLVVSNYAHDNALMPLLSNNTFENFRVLTTFTQDWIYTEGDYQAPYEFSGYTRAAIYSNVSATNNSTRRRFQQPPLLDHYMDQIDMVVLERDREFYTPEVPPKKDYSPSENPIAPTNCYVYTYTFKDDRSSLLFTHVPVQITNCDKDNIYCYGPLNPFSQDYDLNDGVHAGAPVICGNDLMFFNAPYPDHLYRAQFRIIRQRVIQSKLPNQNILTHETPPPWYRVLNCASLNYYDYGLGAYESLPTAVVINDDFFIASSRALHSATRYAQPPMSHYILFDTIKQPTPALIHGLYGKAVQHDDLPVERISYGFSGISVFQRNPGLEMRGGGKNKISSSIEKGQESKEDCWIYRHLPLGRDGELTTFRFTKIKVTIRQCEKGFCHTTPYDGHYYGGAPIVCGGTLSYIYSDFIVNKRYRVYMPPLAIQITTIYAEMKETEDYVKQIKDFEAMSESEKQRFVINNEKTLNQPFAIQIKRVGMPEDEPARH